MPAAIGRRADMPTHALVSVVARAFASTSASTSSPTNLSRPPWGARRVERVQPSARGATSSSPVADELETPMMDLTIDGARCRAR